MSITIEPGKDYITLGGRKAKYVGPNSGCYAATHPHTFDVGGFRREYTDSGVWSTGNAATRDDLIAEWTEPEATPADEPETLRDRFAMAALSGLFPTRPSIPEVARIVYEIADAVMEARKKP